MRHFRAAKLFTQIVWRRWHGARVPFQFALDITRRIHYGASIPDKDYWA